MYTKEEAQAMLPKVGEWRWEIPSVKVEIGAPVPQRCRVVYVNLAHLWYMVQFEDGFRESYKVPRTYPGEGASV